MITNLTPIEILHRAACAIAETGIPDRPEDSLVGIHGALITAAGGYLRVDPQGRPNNNYKLVPDGVAEGIDALAHHIKWELWGGAHDGYREIHSPQFDPELAIRFLRDTAARLQARADLPDALRELARLDAELDHRPDAPADAARRDAWYRRNRAVWDVYDLAIVAGWPAAIDVDPDMPRYPLVIMLELPSGEQVSWHVWAGADRPSMHRMRWDGHDRVEKARRIAAWLAGPVAV